MFIQRLSIVLLGCAFVSTTALPTSAQNQSVADPAPRPTALNSTVKSTVKVGINEIVPFVFLESDPPYGYEIDLWNQVAGDLNLQTEWVPYESFSQMLADLATGKLDAAIAGISITAERESAGLDFSYPSYRSGLQLMVRSSASSPIRALVVSFFNWKIWRPLLLVLATSVGVGALIWLSERNHNEHFSSNPIGGIGQGTWFAIVTLGTFGYGDVTPTRLIGRIVACLWMGASFFILADFIASLTVEQLAKSNLSFKDIQGEAVGVIDSTTAEAYVRAQPVKLVEFENFDRLLSGLAAGEVTAIVHDFPTLKYVANRHSDKFELAGEPLTKEDYGIAFREGNEAIVEAVSQEILLFQERGYMRSLNEKWFGEDAAP